MKKIYLLIIVLIAILTTVKSYFAYQTFHENNVPVYDGVMYENRQIHSYQRYKNNFSLMERINQVYYEFEGNPICAGYTCVIALLAPEWFINDNDVILRSFLAVFVFSFVFFNYLKERAGPFNTILILIALFQLPLFYHFRYGLTTYIPEVTAGLFLLAGYIQVLSFFKTEKNRDFFSAVILIVISIMFRFNFFVYGICFTIPLLYKIVKILAKKSKVELIKVTLFLLLVISFLGFYIFSHLDFFLGYYLGVNDVDGSNSTPYQQLTYSRSFKDLLMYFDMEIGILGGLALVLVWILANHKIEKENKSAFYLIYPFLFHFSFIILFLKSANTPHIIASMVVFLVLVFIVPISFIQKLYVKFGGARNLRIALVGAILLLNIDYGRSCYSFSSTQKELLINKKVVDFISKDEKFDENYKYMCFYDEMLNIQLDVALYKKTGKLLHSNNHFFIHDMYLDDIDPHLNIDKCTNHYMGLIDSVKFNLVLINKEINVPLKFQKVASKINHQIYQKMVSNEDYYVFKTEKSEYHGDVVFFKRKE